MAEDWLIDYVVEIQVTYCDDKSVYYKTTSASLDVNEHILEVYEFIKGNGVPLGKSVDIYYKGKRIFVGDGPRLSRESIRLLAEIDAEVGQDIYCTCSEIYGQSAQQGDAPDPGLIANPALRRGMPGSGDR